MKLNESYLKILTRLTGDNKETVNKILQHLPLDVLNNIIGDVKSRETDKLLNALHKYNRYKLKLGEGFLEGNKMNKLWLTVKNGYKSGGLESLKESLKNISINDWADIWPKMGKPMLLDLYTKANNRTTSMKDFSLSESFLANEIFQYFTGKKMSLPKGNLIPTELVENISNKNILMKKGYTYYVSVNNSDKFMDFLEENKIKYLNDYNGNFNLKLNEKHIDKVSMFLEATDDNNINAPRWTTDSMGQYKGKELDTDYEVDMGEPMPNKVSGSGKVNSLLDDNLFDVDSDGNVSGSGGKFKKTTSSSTEEETKEENDNEEDKNSDEDIEDTQEEEIENDDVEESEEEDVEEKDEEVEEEKEESTEEEKENKIKECINKLNEYTSWPKKASLSKLIFTSWINDPISNEHKQVEVNCSTYGGCNDIEHSNEPRHITIHSVIDDEGNEYEYSILDQTTQDRLNNEANNELVDSCDELNSMENNTDMMNMAMENILKNAGMKVVQEAKKPEDKKPSGSNPVAKNMNKFNKPSKVEDKTKYDRKKQPKAAEEVTEDFKFGDKVMVGENEGTIKIPKGPSGTIGVIIKNKLQMVDADEVSHLKEGVLGMVNLPNINRMCQLAGLKSGSTKLSEFSTIDGKTESLDGNETKTVPTDDFGDAVEDINDDIQDADYEPLPSEFDEVDGDFTGDEDIEGDNFPIAPKEDRSTFTGGNIPTPALQAVGTGSVSSDAYNQIQDHLNNIQKLLPEIRISEFKILIQKIDDLASQSKTLGNSYITESNKKFRK